MADLSEKVIEEVTSLLPGLRKEIAAEFEHWGDTYRTCPQFYSNEAILTALPSAAYEYIILAWGIDPARIDRTAAIEALNNKIFKDIHKITAHALRRIASAHSINNSSFR